MSSSKRALVTGGAVRLGNEICRNLAHEGYHIVIHYRNSEKEAYSLVRDIGEFSGATSTLQADLSKETDTDGLVEKAASLAGGPITLLVNNASSFENDSIEDMTKESWDSHFMPNLWAPMKLAQDMAAQLPKGMAGQIINIIDQRVWALTPKFFSYTLTKSALWTATQTLAQALGPRGIRVNAIGPGPTMQNARQSDEDWARQNEATILGHGATPDDIAASVLYLLKAKAVTGQMIAVDGGQHLAWETPDALISE